MDFLTGENNFLVSIQNMLMEDILLEAIDYGSLPLAEEDPAMTHEFNDALAETSGFALAKSSFEDYNFCDLQQYHDREWSLEDDELLIKLVKEFGPHGNW